jgi:thiol-disulfide isomerase/thioredoxin
MTASPLFTLRIRPAARILFLLIAVVSNSTASSDFDIENFRGKVVVLDFWASWCVPCRRSFPWMNAMHEKYAADGLVIIGVNMDVNPAESTAFLAEFPPRFQIINDHDGDLAKSFNVIAMPSSYVFDREGTQVTRHLGFKIKRQDEYEALLVETLGK